MPDPIHITDRGQLPIPNLQNPSHLGFWKLVVGS
jgi:hypothetical protein